MLSGSSRVKATPTGRHVTTTREWRDGRYTWTHTHANTGRPTKRGSTQIKESFVGKEKGRELCKGQHIRLARRRTRFSTRSRHGIFYVKTWLSTLGTVYILRESENHVLIWDIKEPMRTISTLAVTTISTNIERSAWICSETD